MTREELINRIADLEWEDFGLGVFFGTLRVVHVGNFFRIHFITKDVLGGYAIIPCVFRCNIFVPAEGTLLVQESWHSEFVFLGFHFCAGC